MVDSACAPWLSDQLLKLKTGADQSPLFKIDYGELRKAFRDLQTTPEVGVSPPYVLYQLRHGGPSHDIFTHARTVPEVQRRGRCGRPDSMKRYEAHARLQQQWQKLSADMQAKCLEAEQRLPQLLARYGNGAG
eukprot:14373731-Alexandrium_andersonii.AAC.1